MATPDDWQPVCGSPMHVWDGEMFGVCFSTLAFSYPAHFLAITITAFYLGRFAKKNFLRHSVILPRGIMWALQVLITLLIMDPLLKLTIVIFVKGQQNSFVEDFKLMLMFTLWALKLTYFRRLYISNYAVLPGVVPITAGTLVLFGCQILVILSTANILDYLDLGFLMAYQVLLLAVLICYCALFFKINRQLKRVLDVIPDDIQPDLLTLRSEAGESTGYGSIAASQSDGNFSLIKRPKNFIARFFFFDALPLLKEGYRRGFETVDSLFILPKKQRARYLVNRLRGVMKKQSGRVFPVRDDFSSESSCYHDSTYLEKASARSSPFKALIALFGARYFMLGILRLLTDAAQFATPFMLSRLIDFLDDPHQTLQTGGTYAAILFTLTLFSSIAGTWYTGLLQKMTLQVRSSLVGSIFSKALLTQHAVLSTVSDSGKVLTHLTTDAERVSNICNSFHSTWSIPFQLGVAFFLLYQQLGLYFLAGVIFAIILIPINFLLARKITTLTEEMMASKDERVKLVAEMLQGMKAVKLYCWESVFATRIAVIRSVELWKCLKGRKLLDAFCVYFWATTPLLMQLCTFVTFVLMSGQDLTATRVYTSIALFNMLIAPLNAFPWVVNGVIDALIASRRLHEFFSMPEMQNSTSYFCSECHHVAGSPGSDAESHSPGLSPLAIHVTAPARFIIPRKSQCAEVDAASIQPPFRLSLDTPISVPPGSLVCVIGRLRTGKSSLLLSLAGELVREQGSVYIDGALDYGVGYASQKAWLLPGSIRDNILLGRAYDANRYTAVLAATALNVDLTQLPKGDLTHVGESGGCVLSGGQQSRVGLARAVYDTNQRVFLLDDPMASVDSRVGAHIFKSCIKELLIEQSGATVVMATTRADLANQADVVLFVDENGIVLPVNSNSPLLAAFGTATGRVASGIVDETNSARSSQATEEPKLEGGRDKTPNGVTSGEKAAPDSPRSDSAGEEHRERGSVNWSIWSAYIKACGYGWVIIALLSLVAMQATRNGADIWLSHWVGNPVSTNHSNGSNHSVYIPEQLSDNSTRWRWNLIENLGNSSVDPDDEFYLIVYGSIVGANSIFTFIRAFSFAIAGLYAAGFLHDALLKSVLSAPLSLFETLPIGRILNRFTADVWAIDDSVPFELNIVLAYGVGLLGCLVTIAYASPITLVIIIPLAVAYFFVQRYYRRSSRELKRLLSVTLSPIYSNMAETLPGGFPILRCLRRDTAAYATNNRLIDVNQRVQWNTLVASQWLAMCLQLMGVLAVAACCSAAILNRWHGEENPALVGLAISYALSLTGLLSSLVSSFTEMERQMVSVERVKQYLDTLPSEPMDENEPPTLPPTPSGSHSEILKLEDVWLRYRPAPATPAIRGLSLTIARGQRVAIIGRTGAGKSSIFSALFRLVTIDRGRILLEGVDTAGMSPRQLRRRFAAIPQDPIVFSGSCRFNLDPLGRLTNEDLHQALSACQLSSTITDLDRPLGDRGSSLSTGEKQLLCVARAIASPGALLICADEPTASVDSQTEAIVLQALCQSATASSRTLLMIAHRLENILDSSSASPFDQVVIVDDGTVVETGNPSDLLADTNSTLSKLMASNHST